MKETVRGIVVVEELKNVRLFEGWGKVPGTLKTRNRWEREHRRVRNGEAPAAIVVEPEVVEVVPGGIEESRNLRIVSQSGNITVISRSNIPLYRWEQTQPYSPGSRTLAYWWYEDVFLHYADRSQYISKTNYLGDEIDGWPRRFEYLTTDLVRAHLNGRSIIGTIQGEQTRHRLIDLDFHGRDRHQFLEKAEILLHEFCGDGWHVQVAERNIGGLHLIQILDQPMATVEAVADVRRRIQALPNSQSFEGLEIYPSRSRGCRLPLCRGRVQLLDKPLLPLSSERSAHGKVADVENYMAWVHDPDREYMAIEDVLDYIRLRLAPEFPSAPRRAGRGSRRGRITEAEQKSANLGGWKKKLFPYLMDFWLRGEANGKTLNEHIVVLARYAAVFGHPVDEIVEKIMVFIEELPDGAMAVSRRLRDGELDRIRKAVQASASFASDRNTHQKDALGSVLKFKSIVRKFPNFDPLDKSTWVDGRASGPRIEPLRPMFTPEEKAGLVVRLGEVLNCRDDEEVSRFIVEMVNLVARKRQEGQGWGHSFLRTFMEDRFPAIRCGSKQKRLRILRVLEESRLVFRLTKGSQGMASTWQLGSLAEEACRRGNTTQ